MSKNLLSPVGVAVHTRDVKRGDDYGWYVKAGSIQLFDQMEQIHRLVLRDVGGETPKLAVLLKQHRLGFLIGNMPSQRLDHVNRVINDTLYLEFNQNYHGVFEAVASLLLCSLDDYKEYEQYFTQYAEGFYEKYSQNNSLLEEKFGEIEWFGKNLPSPIKQDKLALALPYNEKSCKKGASYLIEAANSEVSSFSFVATGRVSLEKCQQVALMTEQCVVIIQSSELGEEIDLNKREFKYYLHKLNQVLSTPLRKILTRLSQLSDISLSLLSIGLGSLIVVLVLINLRATTVKIQKEPQITLPLKMQFNGNEDVCLSYNEQYQRIFNYLLNLESETNISLENEKIIMRASQAQKKPYLQEDKK